MKKKPERQISTRYDERADLAAAMAGDKDALGRLIEETTPKVRVTLIKYSKGKIMPFIDDLMQDVKYRTLFGFKNFRGDSAFSSWMTRVGMNAVHSFFTEQKGMIMTSSIARDDESDFEADMIEKIADPARNNPEDILSDRQKVRLIDAFIKTLPEPLQQGAHMVIMNQLEGVEYEDIAATYNIPIGTVRSRMYRFRELAGLHLAEKTGMPSDQNGALHCVAGDYVPTQRNATLKQRHDARHKTGQKTSPEPQ